MGFDPGSASAATSLESQLSFLHIKNALSQKEILRQVRLAICENRRQVLLSRLEAIAGSDNPNLNHCALLRRGSPPLLDPVCIVLSVSGQPDGMS